MNDRSQRPNGEERPPITLSESDADAIAGLAVGIEERMPELAGLLQDEVDRADIVPAGSVPPHIVQMGSFVEFADDSTGRTRTVQLVFPAEADIAAGKISILTPIGAGLIGLHEGHSIIWPDRDGDSHVLRVVKVSSTAPAQNG